LNTKQTAPKRAQQGSHEQIFCIAMLLFIIFEMILLTVILIGALTPPAVATPSVGDDETSSGDGSEEDTTKPDDTKIFSGGVVPSRPQADENTRLIAGIGSQYALLIDAKSGAVLAALGENTRFEPASLTKVMTLIVACEHLEPADLDRKLTLSHAAWDYARSGAYTEASVVGHDVGDEIRIRDLLYGIGMESAADCTVMIVEEVAGDEAAFVKLMNDKAAELGLTDTHFDNAIGHESENNYSTATEMAMIMSYAMQSDLIREILGLTQHAFRMWYYNESGVYTEFGFTYYSTLFRSRMETYKKYAKEDFSLSKVKLTAGKTGSFITSSYVVCTAKAKSGGGEYILVLGDAPKPEGASAGYVTMCDIKTVLDTYIP